MRGKLMSKEEKKMTRISLMMIAALVLIGSGVATDVEAKDGPSATPAVTGVVAGVVAGNAGVTADAAVVDRQREVQPAQPGKAAEAEEARLTAQQEARRQAATERVREKKRLALEREASCAIKPVMSDAEIAHCKVIRSLPPP